MIHAYSNEYLDDAMRNLGEALDYAVNSCNMAADAFIELFFVSDLAAQFETGVPKVVSGMSGTELVWEVLRQSGLEIPFPDPQIEYECSAQYWCGWILAYYQWYTGRRFKDIHSYISMEEIEKMYPALHESPEEKFIDAVNKRIKNQNAPTNLQTLRKNAGYSQRVLSEKSGVNLRTLQQYELRAKDITKASGRILSALSKTLGCRMEDLLEYDTNEV